MQPSEDDHPRIRELWAGSAAPLTWWRMKYNLPPNDPRVLDVDENVVLDDLLVTSFNELRAAIARSPSLGVATDPKAVAALEAEERDEAARAKLKRQMERMARREAQGGAGAPLVPRDTSTAAASTSRDGAKGGTILGKLNPWGRNA